MGQVRIPCGHDPQESLVGVACFLQGNEQRAAQTTLGAFVEEATENAHVRRVSGIQVSTNCSGCKLAARGVSSGVHE